MSNSDVELREIDRFVDIAYGNVFVGGLGMGLVVNELVKKESVKTVVVCEILSQLIDFIKDKQLLCDPLGKVSIFCGDAREIFSPTIDSRDIFLYDTMYWDLWIEPTEGAYCEALKCFRKGQAHLRQGGILDAWELPRMKKGNFIQPD